MSTPTWARHHIVIHDWNKSVMQGSAIWMMKNLTGKWSSSPEDEVTGYGPLTFSFEKESDAVLFALRWKR